MNQQDRNEQLRAETEARRSMTGGSASSWDRIQSALRRYLTTEGSRSTRQDVGRGKSPR